MATTLRLDKLTKHADGRVEIVYTFNGGGGLGIIFPDQQAVLDMVQVEATQEEAVRYLLAWWIARQPDLSNTNLVVGKTLTVDWAASNPLRIQ